MDDGSKKGGKLRLTSHFQGRGAHLHVAGAHLGREWTGAGGAREGVESDLGGASCYYTFHPLPRTGASEGRDPSLTLRMTYEEGKNRSREHLGARFRAREGENRAREHRGGCFCALEGFGCGVGGKTE